MRYILLLLIICLIFAGGLRVYGVNNSTDDTEPNNLLLSEDQLMFANSTKIFDNWLRETNYHLTINVLDPEEKIVLYERVSDKCDPILAKYGNEDFNMQSQILKNWETCANGELKSDFLTSKLSEIINEQKKDIEQLTVDNQVLLKKMVDAQQQIVNLKTDNQKQIESLKKDNENQFYIGIVIALGFFVAGICADRYIGPKLK